MSVLYQKEQS